MNQFPEFIRKSFRNIKFVVKHQKTNSLRFYSISLQCRVDDIVQRLSERNDQLGYVKPKFNDESGSLINGLRSRNSMYYQQTGRRTHQL